MLKILSTGCAALFLMGTALSTPSLAHGVPSGGGGSHESGGYSGHSSYSDHDSHGYHDHDHYHWYYGYHTFPTITPTITATSPGNMGPVLKFAHTTKRARYPQRNPPVSTWPGRVTLSDPN
jgi:hypothetical protein